ncbi:hypothetical protein [Geodermatophilus nigrescens]|uniref:Uncharacterized protein n=1 Tax=Geodermatophilus nigrescens TaxID=1070870 RepID=A0A1M5I0E2_9ACTN|nr:hypothetical protein [Geodermatophilus nigrescens]SHG21520.1 hypothetical protein SAMN05444351_1825 [Geodermatophilus nigrescens]
MTTFYVLDVPENVSVATVAGQGPDVTVARVGPYFEISAPGAIVVDRRATGCRHAVWYSCVAGLRGARVTQQDKDALRVEPV